MTDKELKKLGRADLVEMLLDVTRENEKLREELAQTQMQLENKTITIEKAGTLAEATLHLNGVFEAAQNACEQYMLNVQQNGDCYSDLRNPVEFPEPETQVIDVTDEPAESAGSQKNQEVPDETMVIPGDVMDLCGHMEEETRKKCDRMEQEAQERCNRMELEAQRKCDRMLKRAKQEADEYWEYVRKNAHTLHLERHKSGGSEQGEV